jgi:maltooligosyltrehalose trehalohydrolase
MLKELGANYIGDNSFGFFVWAPLRKSVQLKIVSPSEKIIQMEKLENGYFGTVVKDIEEDARYVYILDEEIERPDPASRFQPDGVHKPSQIIRHDTFRWEDSDFELPLEDYIIYELHVGTFTPEGTFKAIIPKLPYLKELGVTALELMPVAQFPGARNWGYDGVYPFAVQNTYGGPDALKSLVNECHKNGLAVILDVVYNHLGPEGNYLGDFAPYFTDRYKAPWGQAINFDGPLSDEVRRYFIENALYWVEKFHIDALRIDAVHGIFDFSAKHFLSELRETVKERASRKVYLIAESDLNDVRLINPPDKGGYGLDAQWNDDFHHALHTLLTGEQQGYYKDFGKLWHMTKALKEGFVYSGQYSEFRKRRHGSSSSDRPARQFVVFCQNHDQVGNRMAGDRLSESQPLEKIKLAAAMVILSPYIPLLFMGEEYGETAPFQYFTSHSDKALAEAVTRGRKEEFAAFKWQREIPDPQSESTFLRSKINTELHNTGNHRILFDFYKTLIRMRKELPPLKNLSKDNMEVKDYEPQKVILIKRWHGNEQLLLAVNFNETTVQIDNPFDGTWQKVFDSSSDKWAGTGNDFFVKIDRLLQLNPYSLSLYRMEM